MNRFLCHALIIVTLGSVLPPGKTGSAQDKYEWPQLKGNPGFTGLSPDDSIKPPLKLKWSYRLDGDASGDAGAGVIVAGGKSLRFGGEQPFDRGNRRGERALRLGIYRRGDRLHWLPGARPGSHLSSGTSRTLAQARIFQDGCSRCQERRGKMAKRN